MSQCGATDGSTRVAADGTRCLCVCTLRPGHAGEHRYWGLGAIDVARMSMPEVDAALARLGVDVEPGMASVRAALRARRERKDQRCSCPDAMRSGWCAAHGWQE